MMGIMVPETCWANIKFYNKNQSILGLLFPRISEFIVGFVLWNLWFYLGKNISNFGYIVDVSFLGNFKINS